MATAISNTTSKGVGNYIGETKKQLRDGESNNLSDTIIDLWTCFM